MEFLVYHSIALVAPGSAEADAIVAASARNNDRHGLTGFLHHEPDLFVQYVEGPADALETAWARILADRRHGGAITIGRGIAARRFFDGCFMGYSDGHTAQFFDFLDEAAGKSRVDEATMREVVWFLRGACQRSDLGLTT